MIKIRFERLGLSIIAWISVYPGSLTSYLCDFGQINHFALVSSFVKWLLYW